MNNNPALDNLINRIFENEDVLKQHIINTFQPNEQPEIINGSNGDVMLDDELVFFAGDYDYSIYFMTGKSGRVIVVETGRQHG